MTCIQYLRTDSSLVVITETKALDNYVWIPQLANLFITYLILNWCSLDPQRSFKHIINRLFEWSRRREIILHLQMVTLTVETFGWGSFTLGINPRAQQTQELKNDHRKDLNSITPNKENNSWVDPIKWQISCPGWKKQRAISVEQAFDDQRKLGLNCFGVKGTSRRNNSTRPQLGLLISTLSNKHNEASRYHINLFHILEYHSRQYKLDALVLMFRLS